MSPFADPDPTYRIGRLRAFRARQLCQAGTASLHRPCHQSL